jgi:hypothetical protein
MKMMNQHDRIDVDPLLEESFPMTLPCPIGPMNGVGVVFE